MSKLELCRAVAEIRRFLWQDFATAASWSEIRHHSPDPFSKFIGVLTAVCPMAPYLLWFKTQLHSNEDVVVQSWRKTSLFLYKLW